MMIYEILKISRPRTWIFSILAFLIACFYNKIYNFFIILFGIVIYSFCTASTNIINVYFDRKEDLFLFPYRIYLVNKIGQSNVLKIGLFLYFFSIFLSFFNLYFLFVYLLAVFVSFFYSAPPLRFKKRLIPGFLAFSGAVFFPLWSCNAMLTNNFFRLPILYLFLSYWFATYGMFKNLPDYEIDKKFEIINFATIFNSIKKAKLFAAIILISPYIILLFLIIANLLKLKFIFLFLLTPFLLYVLINLLKSKTSKELETVHTYGFFYAVIFLEVVLIVLNFNLLILLLLCILDLFLILIHILKADVRR